MPFDPQFAQTLARFASDAYQAYLTDDEFLVGYRNLDGSWQQSYDQAAWLRTNGYQLVQNPSGSTRSQKFFGVIGTTADAVVVAFRGTATFDDIAIDALGGGAVWDGSPRISFPFSTWTAGSTTVWVHQNFLTTYQGLAASVRNAVTSLFHSTTALTKLYITGHSLGAGLASICAIDLAISLASDPLIPEPRLWTFASPFVGDQKFATALNTLTAEAYRINQANDWVPTVPSRGWTPAWMQWWQNGSQGPEPMPKFVPYVHGGSSIAISTSAWFPGCHALTNYYLGCQQLAAANANPVLAPTDLVTSLSVRIKTRDTLGAGTDNDVFVSLLGVSWGPLDKPGDDFAQGATGEYDLFAMFPDKIPPNPRVGDITSVGLHLGDGLFYVSVWTMAWDPEWIDVIVNGVVFAHVSYTGTLTWSTSRDITTPISLPT